MSCLRSKETGEKDMNFIVAKKNAPEGLILVITDKEIFGKVFEEGNKQLDLTKEYYLGEEMSKDEVKKLIKIARHIVLTGKESVAVGIEMGLFLSESILYVEKVPHAQVVIA